MFLSEVKGVGRTDRKQSNMPRGNKPKQSKTDNERRIFTWRYEGRLHNRLLEVVSKTNLSINYYITKAMRKQIEEDEAKSEEKE
jgi:predicted HicB family RNase H-like nuclease